MVMPDVKRKEMCFTRRHVGTEGGKRAQTCPLLFGQHKLGLGRTCQVVYIFDGAPNLYLYQCTCMESNHTSPPYGASSAQGKGHLTSEIQVLFAR